MQNTMLTTDMMLSDDGATALPADSSVAASPEDPSPETIQDFDLDLLGSPKPELSRSASDQLLQDLLDLDGSWSALRNDVMLPAQSQASKPAVVVSSSPLLGVGYMPEEETLHRPVSHSVSR